MPLRFFVQTAITIVTPPVVFHSFPLPVTHFSSSRCGGTTALSLRTWRSHGLQLPFDGGSTAIIGGMTAVLAAALRGQ